MGARDGASGKQTPREKIAEDVAAFLKAKGRIQVIPNSVSAMSGWSREKESKHARERILGLRPSPKRGGES